MRGRHLGEQLVQTCIDYAREIGYKSLTLWTNDVLTAARGIYEKKGFRLTHSEPHHEFGPSMVGQTWALDLDHR